MLRSKYVLLSHYLVKIAVTIGYTSNTNQKFGKGDFRDRGKYVSGYRRGSL